MGDLRALLNACQKNIDDAFQWVFDDLHQQRVDQSFLRPPPSMSAPPTVQHETEQICEIISDLAIFQEVNLKRLYNSFSRPPPSVHAPPMMQHEQEQNWIIDSNAGVESQSLVVKQLEQDKLVQEPLIPEMDRSVSYSEHTAKNPPPQLSSMHLNGQTVYVVMPLMSSEIEFVIPEWMRLQWTDPKQPLCLYIDSPGTTYEEFATTEAAMIKQRISIILVFDPGKISFIDMVIKTCIATSIDIIYF